MENADEKVLARSEIYDLRKFAKIMTAIGVVVMIGTVLLVFVLNLGAKRREMNRIQEAADVTYAEVYQNYDDILNDKGDAFGDAIEALSSADEDYFCDSIFQPLSDEMYEKGIKDMDSSPEYQKELLKQTAEWILPKLYPNDGIYTMEHTAAEGIVAGKSEGEVKEAMVEGGKALFMDENAFYGMVPSEKYAVYAVGFAIGAAIIVLGWLIYAAFHVGELTITDRRVVGKTTWGKQVELPRRQISAIAMGGLKGIAIATSSGRIRFSLIKNRDELYRVLSGLIGSAQPQPSSVPVPVVQQSTDADELAKFKSLLDSGAITQEEYDAKKK